MSTFCQIDPQEEIKTVDFLKDYLKANLLEVIYLGFRDETQP